METALKGVNNLNELNSLTSDLNQSMLKNNLNPYKGAVRKESTSGDALSIGIMTPEKTQAILNRELADKLEQRFKEEGIDLKGLKAEDFTPQKVSERIMNFVSGRVLSEQDSEKQQELMQQARDGVEQGFAEARDILDSLSVLNGKVKDDVDKTYDLIQQGLDKLNQQINSQGDKDNDGDKESQETDAEAKVEASGQLSMQSRFSRSESTRVEILTNEGDRILVDLFKNQSAEQQTHLQQSEDGNSYSSSRSISASAGISYQVQGDLNSDEQKAIDELMANIANVSERFFSGDVQNAFQYAQSMDFNTQELTQFSLNMSYQESRQVAINTYGSYLPETSAKDSAQNSADKTPALQDAAETIRQIDDLLQNPFASQKFADPAQSVSELLKAMNEQLYADSMQQMQQDSAAMLDALVEQIKQFRGAESIVADTENSMITG